MMRFSPFINNEELRNRLLSEYAAEREEKFCALENWLFTSPKFTTIRVNSNLISVDAAEEKLKGILQKLYSGKLYPIPKIFLHPLLPDLLIVECTEYLDAIKPCENEIIVDHLCGAAVLRGAHVYVPGVIGACAGIQKGTKVSVYADLEKQCLKGWMKPYTGQKFFLGNGIAQVSRQELFTGQVLSGIAVEMTEKVNNSPPLGDVLDSELYLQNLPSIVCSHVLNPKPGDWVLDMCASPGGKTTHLATIMKDKGLVIALDKTRPKIEKIMMNAKRFNLSCIHAYVHDSTKAQDCSKSEEDAKILRDSGNVPIPPFPCQLFDSILLDAPCSALGQRPQLSNFMTASELSSYSLLQRKLFKVGVNLLKENGTLVYSTCTITLAENESVVKWALDSFPELCLESQVPHIGGKGIPAPGLSCDQLSKLQRFQPQFDEVDSSTASNCCDTNTIGFFIAKFSKRKK